MTTNPTLQFGQHFNGDPFAAGFFWTGGPIEVAKRTWFTSYAVGVTAFETTEGLVIVDSGTAQIAPVIARALREHTALPLHTALITHGHMDHAYGVKAFLVDGQRAPRVVAHPAAADRFARYARTAGLNTAVNVRQLSGSIEGPMVGGVTFDVPEIPPDTFYDGDDVTYAIGGLTFECHHARGETDDATWVWCPERKVLCPGDLFIWAVPNCGNPQKVQRFPWDWARALRQMAALGADVLCPGHGGPVIGDPTRIEEMLVTTADFLDDIVDQTVAAMNDGGPPAVDVVHRVRLPTTTLPWLRPIYDEGEFIIRNVLRYFGGWWTGRPSELKPAPRDDVATEIVALAGGAARLAARATELASDGQLRLACHLADYALEAAPDDPTIADAVGAVYEQRARGETSLMAANIFNAAAAYASARRPFC